MSELNIKMVPLSAIDYALNEATEGWHQFLDTDEMKVVAVPEDREEVGDLYVPDEEIVKLIIEDKDGRFILMPPAEEVEDLDMIYDFSTKEGVRAYGTIWCQEHGFSVFDDLNLIGLDRQQSYN